MKKAYLAVIGLVIGSVLTLAATYTVFCLTHPTGNVYVMVDGNMVELNQSDEYVQTVKAVVDELDNQGIVLPGNAKLSISQGYENLMTDSSGERYFDLVYYNGLHTGDVYMTTIQVYTEKGHTHYIQFQGMSGIEIDGQPTNLPQRQETATKAAKHLARRPSGRF